MFYDTVSVNDTVWVLDQHFGSAYTMADYESSNHNLFLSLTFMPSSDFSLTGHLNYTKSKNSWGDIEFPDVRAALGTDTLSHQNFDFGEINKYSDLEYGIIRLGLGGEYRLSPKMSLSADMEWADFDDKLGYVYGDESGSYLFIRSGIRYEF